MYYEKHVFVCENVRAEGERESCGPKGAKDLRALLKQKVKEQLPGRRIRINASGCLDRCEEGPTQVVYPQAKWFCLKNEADIDRFINEYLALEDLDPHGPAGVGPADSDQLADIRLSDIHPVDRHRQRREQEGG